MTASWYYYSTFIKIFHTTLNKIRCFLLDKFYDQNIFEISPFLKQKCEKRNNSFATKTNPDKQDYIRLCSVTISWECEKFKEDLYKIFDEKITIEIEFAYHPKFMELMDRL
jgi:hypothetical protein